MMMVARLLHFPATKIRAEAPSARDQNILAPFCNKLNNASIFAPVSLTNQGDRLLLFDSLPLRANTVASLKA